MTVVLFSHEEYFVPRWQTYSQTDSLRTSLHRKAEFKSSCSIMYSNPVFTHRLTLPNSMATCVPFNLFPRALRFRASIYRSLHYSASATLYFTV